MNYLYFLSQAAKPLGDHSSPITARTWNLTWIFMLACDFVVHPSCDTHMASGNDLVEAVEGQHPAYRDNIEIRR